MLHLLQVFATLDSIKRALQAAMGMPAAILASLAFLQQKLAARKPVAARHASGRQAAAAAAPETRSSNSSSNSGGAATSTSRSNNAAVKSRSHAPDMSAVQGRPQAPPQTLASTSSQQQEQRPPGPDALPCSKQQQQKAAGPLAVTGSKQQARAAPTSSTAAAGGEGAAALQDAARAAPAGAEKEATSLVARARAAAGKRMADDEEEDTGEPATHCAVASSSCLAWRHSLAAVDSPAPRARRCCCAVPAGPSPAVRKRLSQQMSALEVQMWDPAPEPTGPKVLLSKVVSALFVAAALVVVVGGCRQRTATIRGVPAQQGACSLLVDARG